MPVSTLRSVDFPEPLAPMMPKNSPFLTMKLMSWRAVKTPWRWNRPSDDHSISREAGVGYCLNRLLRLRTVTTAGRSSDADADADAASGCVKGMSAVEVIARPGFPREGDGAPGPPEGWRTMRSQRKWPKFWRAPNGQATGFDGMRQRNGTPDSSEATSGQSDAGGAGRR